MYTIIEHIEYLLTSHDCVVIPGWGALVAQYTDSYYAPAAGHIERPRRKLGFNASVDHNDGLLAQSLVRREHIPYSEAMRFIGQSVSAFRAQLAQGNEVSMGRLGYFHSADGRRIEFTPFQHEQSNDAYFGLRSVEFRPLAEEAARAQAVAAAAAAFEQNANAPRTLWNRRVARIAASIAVLLCLTILLTTPIIVNRDQQNYASLNLPSVTKPQQQVLNEGAEFRSQGTEALSEVSSQDADVLSGMTPDGSREPASPLLLDEGGNCYLVVASLTSTKEVNEFKRMHSALAANMQVLRVGKYHYIYVARSYDAKHLYSLVTQLPKGYQGWVKTNG